MKSQDAPVLVVDDDAQLRELMQWALEDEGLEVRVAASGTEAVELIASARPSLVVLDMTLPGLDGFGVAEFLRKERGALTPLVMITADGSAAQKAERIGATAFLRKPFEMSRLVGVVRHSLDQPQSR